MVVLLLCVAALSWSIPGFMHTLFRVTGVLSGVESSVVLGLGFCGWASVKAVHKPAFVVPAHPPHEAGAV